MKIQTQYTTKHMHNLVLHNTLVLLHLPAKDVHYLVVLWRKLGGYLYLHTYMCEIFVGMKHEQKCSIYVVTV